jgi:DNA-binding GntR family transcriptional regulator
MEAYEFIRNAILEGDYEPGKRLTEEFLAAELNVSRTPIREALKRLESEGLITSLKRGMCVRSFSPTDVRQIYDLRALLESYAASQAAVRRAETDLDELFAANRLYAQAIQQLPDTKPVNRQIKNIVLLNNRFHEAVLNACKNDHIQFLISKVIVLPLVYRSFYWYDQSEIKRSLLDHQTIAEAIQSGDPERARSAMLEHIYKGRDHVLRHLTLAEKEDKEEWE